MLMFSLFMMFIFILLTIISFILRFFQIFILWFLILFVTFRTLPLLNIECLLDLTILCNKGHHLSISSMLGPTLSDSSFECIITSYFTICNIELKIISRSFDILIVLLIHILHTTYSFDFWYVSLWCMLSYEFLEIQDVVFLKVWDVRNHYEF